MQVGRNQLPRTRVYALAVYLSQVDSCWYLQHPVPKEFREALAIVFDANVDLGVVDVVEDIEGDELEVAADEPPEEKKSSV